MREQTGQYVNEVVSLSIMLLMAVALIAGQAGASAHQVARADADIAAAPAPSIEATALIETDLAVLSLHFDMALDNMVESFSVEDTVEILGEVVRDHLNAEK